MARLDNHARNRALINKAKDVPCADCLQRYPAYVMDFDHVRGKKRFAMGAVAKKRPSVKTLLEEIAKCDVVCSNCHRIRTFDRNQFHTSSLPKVEHLTLF